MDLLAELGLVPLPAAPAPGAAASSSTTPAGRDPGDFAAHMQEAPRARPPEPAPAARSGKGPIAGERPIASDTGELAAPEPRTAAIEPEQRDPAGTSTRAPDGGHARLDSAGSALAAAAALEEQVVEGGSARPHRRDLVPDGDRTRAPSPVAAIAGASACSIPEEPAAAIEPGSAAGTAGASTRARPGAREAEAPGREIEAQSDRPILPSALDLLFSKPGPDAPTTGANDAEAAPPAAGGPATAAGSGTSAVGEAAAPAGPVVGGELAADALRSLRQPTPPGAIESGVSTAAVRAGDKPLGASARSRPLPGVAQIAPAGEPPGALGPGRGAGELSVRKKLAAPEAPLGAQHPSTEEAAPKRPAAGDPQIGRLSQLSGPAGNGAALPPPAIGAPADLGQAAARPLDAVAFEAGRYPATQQVALQISKALDEGTTEIRILLDPPELGEVDVHLEFRELRLSATISVERPDTLDLLQRDARTLARALREAGVELADSDLSFAPDGRGDRPDAGAYAQRAIGLPRAFAASPPLQDSSRALGGPGGFVSLSEGRMDLRV